MSFESTMTEHDLDPAAVQFAEDLKRQNHKPEREFSVDGFNESFGNRLLRLFRRQRD